MSILLRTTAVIAFASGCIIPPFEAMGKSCTTDAECGAPLRCQTAGDGARRCTSASDADAGRWLPPVGTSWQIQVTQPIAVDIDAAAFAIPLSTPRAIVDQLKQRGRRIICRAEAGVGDSRDPTITALPASVVGNIAYASNYRWLDIRSSAVRERTLTLLDTAQQLGCDGVALTSLDGFQDTTGFMLTMQIATDFLLAMAPQARQRGLSLGLDNTVELAAAVADDVDWATNGSCFQFNECQRLEPFIQRNKAVFHFETGGASTASTICPQAKALQFSTIIKNANLDATRTTCPP
jgi:hypothetical protein